MQNFILPKATLLQGGATLNGLRCALKGGGGRCLPNGKTWANALASPHGHKQANQYHSSE